MSSQFFHVRIDAEGIFYSQCGPGKKLFFASDERLLTLSSLPVGAWPVCFAATDHQDFLYFTYFLSGTLHKWHLTRAGRNETGDGADRRELIPFFKENLDNPDVAWLIAKLSPVGLRLQDFPAPPPGKFTALEYAVAHAIVQGKLRDLLFSLVDGGSGNVSKSDQRSVIRHLQPPRGYRAAVPLSLSQSFEINNIWAYVESGACEIRLDAALILFDRVVFETNEGLAPTLVRLTCNISDELPNILCGVLHSNPTGRSSGGGGFVQTLQITLSRNLISSQEDPDNQNIAIGRLKHSLDVLIPYWLLFLGANPTPFKLNFCFDDSGAKDFIGFDRCVGSEDPIVPDLYQLNDSQTRQHLPVHDEQLFEDTFRSKLPVLFWRGSTTGSMMVNLSEFVNNPRVRSCRTIQAQLLNSADCKITSIVQLSNDLVSAEDYLRHLGLKGNVVPESDFGLRQFFIDLPGNGAAWGSFRKYLFGCVVLRPMPPARELAYHRVLEPWQDFVPVRNDLADVGDVVRRLIDNPSEAAAIAYRGRKKVIEFLRNISDEVLQVLQSAAT